MKHGKKPKKNQKIAIKAAGLDPKEWLITKNLVDKGELHIVNRSGKAAVIVQ
jgi:hypothetical protein